MPGFGLVPAACDPVSDGHLTGPGLVGIVLASTTSRGRSASPLTIDVLAYGPLSPRPKRAARGGRRHQDERPDPICVGRAAGPAAASGQVADGLR